MSERLKVGIIGSYPPTHVGGSSTHVQLIARRLQRRHSVEVITPGNEKKSWRDEEVKVCEERVNDKHRIVSTVLKMALITLKRRKKWDIIHAHGSLFAVGALLVRKKPLVLTVHGRLALETVARGETRKGTFAYRVLDLMELLTLKRADQIIAVTERIYNWITKEKRIRKEKVHHLANCVDAHWFKPHPSTIRELHGIDSEAPLILYIKALKVYNGPEYAIRAMRDIIAEVPSAKLLMVGDGPLRTDLENLAKSLGLERTVVFTGSVPHEKSLDYFSAADVVIIPSIPVEGVEEGSSMTLLEAFSCAKAVVASSVGGLREVIGGSNAGILVKDKAPEELARAVIDLLNDPVRTSDLGDNARQYVMTHHNLDDYVSRLGQIYEKALRSNRARRALSAKRRKAGLWQ